MKMVGQSKGSNRWSSLLSTLRQAHLACKLDEAIPVPKMYVVIPFTASWRSQILAEKVCARATDFLRSPIRMHCCLDIAECCSQPCNELRSHSLCATSRVECSSGEALRTLRGEPCQRSERPCAPLMQATSHISQRYHYAWRPLGVPFADQVADVLIFWTFLSSSCWSSCKEPNTLI